MDRSWVARARAHVFERGRDASASRSAGGVPLRAQGADSMRGGHPVGPGHAGRRASAIVALFALVLMLLAVAVRPAIAASIPSTLTIGAVSRVNPATGRHDVVMWNAKDNSPVFCADQNLSEPANGSVLTGGRWTGSLMLDYVLYHGAADPVHGFDDKTRSWTLTKYAVWAIRESGEDHAEDWVNATLVDAADRNDTIAFLQKARAFKNSGGNGPERGTSAIYSSGSSYTQDVVWFAGSRTGKASLRKTSSLDSITEGNPCYSFEGIQYGVYDSPTDFSAAHLKAVITLDASGSGTSGDLPAGTYYLREGSCDGSGYARSEAVTKVEVVAGETKGVTVADEPQGLLEWSLVAKRDSQTGATPQGDASLEGAVFEVSYYANLDGATSGTPVRTWLLETDAEGIVHAGTAHLAGGDALYEKGGSPFLPLGTYAIRESKAPEGYELADGEVRTLVLKPNGTAAASASWEGSSSWSADGPEGRGVANDVFRGGIKLGKVDAENGRHLASGDATLAGAQLEISNASKHAVTVGGKSFAPGEVVMTLKTNDRGLAQTAEDALPYGTYKVRETQPPEGYLGNASWERTVEIRKPGFVDCSGEASSVADRVVRGGLRFNKVHAQTMERLPKVVFKVTSLTTGESHLLVADENGIVDTERNAHSAKTNANDAALRKDGSVDEGKLDAGAGVYFSGRTDVEVRPRDSFGALPYDSYRIEELRTSANAGLELVSFTVHVHEEKTVVEMGTVDDDLGPAIGTELTSQEGAHMIPATGTAYLVDVIRYEGLERGKTYEVHGELMDGETGKPLGPSADASFVARTTSGEVRLCFEVDAPSVAGKRAVAFEEVTLDGKLVAEHKDLKDADQSVRIPEIGTTLSGEEGERVLAAEGTIHLVDVVSYKCLQPGLAYEVTGELYDKATGESLGITSSTKMVAKEESGTCEVEFEVDAALLASKVVVAFESVTHQEREIAIHADIEDDAQTSYIPKIKTTLACEDGTKDLEVSDGPVALIDTIAFEGLEPGMAYLAKGQLMDKETGEPLGIEGSAEFTPEASSGTCEMRFEIEPSLLSGKTLVAFEEVSLEGRVVARHEDIDDIEQTLSIPRIGTTLTGSEGEKAIEPTGTITLVDLIEFEGLVPGHTYEVTGQLMDKLSGAPLGFAATAELVPDEPTGTCEVRFELEASAVAGKTIVAFESVSTEGKVVAIHADIEDEDQTVVVDSPNPPAPRPVPKPDPLPKTGDEVLPFAAVGAGGIALAGAAIALRARTRDRRPKDPTVY